MLTALFFCEMRASERTLGFLDSFRIADDTPGMRRSRTAFLHVCVSQYAAVAPNFVYVRSAHLAFKSHILACTTGYADEAGAKILKGIGF